MVACGTKKAPVSSSEPVPVVETEKKESVFTGQWTDLRDQTGDVIATRTDESNQTGSYIGSPSIFALASDIEISQLAFNSEKSGEYGEQISLTINDDLTGTLYSSAYMSYDKDFEGTSANVFENISQNGNVVAKENEDGSYTLDIEMLLIHFTMCKDQSIDERVEKTYNLTVVCSIEGNNATCTHEDGKTVLKK